MICLSYLILSYLTHAACYKNVNVWRNCPIMHLGTKEGNHEKQEPEPADAPQDKTPQDDTPYEARPGAKEIARDDTRWWIVWDGSGMRVGWVKALLIEFDHLIDPFGNLGSLEHMFCIVAHLRCTVSGHQSSPNFFRWRYDVRFIYNYIYIYSIYIFLHTLRSCTYRHCTY